MNQNIVMTRGKKDVYEIQYVVHRAASAPSDATDVYACYRMSNYDGMPIGPLVWIAESELIEADRLRVKGHIQEK